jgi:photosystem II stability/assembly factor-like uncharacterized protein
VLVSHDAGETFAESNDGLSERKVAALLVDRNDPNLLYAGVVNDKKYGGVFKSTDGGVSWQRIAKGLDGRDVYALSQTKDGTIVAGTSHGIFVLTTSPDASPHPSADPSADPPGDPPAAGSAGPASAALGWEPKNMIANTVTKYGTEKARGKSVNIAKRVKAPVIELESRVTSVDVSGDVWAASTDAGVLTSHDKGATWQGGPVMGAGDYLDVAAHGETMVAARTDGVVISKDSGQSWWPLSLPTMLTGIHRVAFSPDGTLWLGAREGVYFTRDLGKTWLWIERLPFRDVDDLSYDATLKKMLVSSRASDQVFAIDPKNMTWQYWQAGYQIALIRNAGERLIAASVDDGVLLGPNAVGEETGRK